MKALALKEQLARYVPLNQEHGLPGLALLHPLLRRRKQILILTHSLLKLLPRVANKDRVARNPMRHIISISTVLLEDQRRLLLLGKVLHDLLLILRVEPRFRINIVVLRKQRLHLLQRALHHNLHVVHQLRHAWEVIHFLHRFQALKSRLWHDLVRPVKVPI